MACEGDTGKCKVPAVLIATDGKENEEGVCEGVFFCVAHALKHADQLCQAFWIDYPSGMAWHWQKRGVLNISRPDNKTA